MSDERCDHCGLTGGQVDAINDTLFETESEFQARRQRARLARGEATTDDIVEAVMLERERCAKIIEAEHAEICEGMYERCMCEDLARRIRRDE